MKTIQLIVAILFLSLPTFSNSYDDVIKKITSISGQVIDKNTGGPLTGVAVKLTGLNLTVYTDFEGNFSVKNILPGKYDLMISMLTYKKLNKEKFSVLKGESNYLKIELETLK